MSNEVENIDSQKLVGVLAQFDDPNTLLHACENARDAGFKKMDAYTPFPIHGIEKAIGIPRTILPFIVLAVGLSGCAIGIGMQWYTNGTEQLGPLWSGYQFRISGKPLFSLPANIPIAFEIIVLSSAFAAFFGMLILNKLPRLANPLHRIPRFKRVTNDKFFLMIEANDENFDGENLPATLSEWGATDVEQVHEDQTDHQLPAFLKTLAVLGIILALIPPALIYRARGMTYKQTRLHVVPDMDFQIKFKAQTIGPIADDYTPENPKYFFQRLRSSFHSVPGTISRESESTDDEFFRGFKEGTNHFSQHGTSAKLASAIQEEGAASEGTQEEEAAAEEVQEPEWVTTFPSQIKVNEDTLMRGQQRYNIYCAVCHGYAGEGNGLANNRAAALNLNAKAEWTEAKTLYDPEVVKQPIGRVFDTITNGRATMGPYASRIQPEDRWAIVLYIKAMQETHKNAISEEPEETDAAKSEAATPAADGDAQ